MVKTKNKSTQHPLVITGYVLFALLVISVLLSTTIPFGRMLFDPRVLHNNVALITIALTVGAILPVLVGYIIGDHSVRSKSRLSHHFNGVLFGLLAYWLMMLLSVFVLIPSELPIGYNAKIILINLVPSLGVTIATTILAIAHVRSRVVKQDILDYKPFSVMLITSILVLPVWSLVHDIVTNSVGYYSFLSPAIIVVLGLIAYASLRKTSLASYSKVVWSAVAVSVAFMTAYVVSQLVYAIAMYIDARPTMESQLVVSAVGLALALAGWIFYWSKQVKLLRNSSRSNP